jgi:tetratricopeptide (TPR) repeat protein
MDPVLEVFVTESEKLVKSFERGDYSETIRIAQGMLAGDKENKEASEYLALARERMSQSQIAKYIAAGKREYESGNYEQSIASMEQALKMNRNSTEAQRYYDLADRALSERTIRQIVEHQRNAEEQKDLLALLSDIGPEALAAKKRADAMQLFNSYDDINSRVADIQVDFIDKDHADVSFSHLLVGVDKKTNSNKVIFEGKKTLTLERTGNAWKILVYR